MGQHHPNECVTDVIWEEMTQNKGTAGVDFKIMYYQRSMFLVGNVGRRRDEQKAENQNPSLFYKLDTITVNTAVSPVCTLFLKYIYILPTYGPCSLHLMLL